MTTEFRGGTPVQSDTVEYGGMQILVAPGETVYGSKDVIHDGRAPRNTTHVIFGNNNPFTSESPGVGEEWEFNHWKQIYEPRELKELELLPD